MPMSVGEGLGDRREQRAPASCGGLRRLVLHAPWLRSIAHGGGVADRARRLASARFMVSSMRLTSG